MGASRAENVAGVHPLTPQIPPDGPPVEAGLERRASTRPRGSLRLVLVRWHDAWFDLEQPAEGWRETYLVQTVGYVVRETPQVVSVAQELLPGRDGFRAVTHIPRRVIDSVTTLFQEDGPGRRAGDRALQTGD